VLLGPWRAGCPQRDPRTRPVWGALGGVLSARSGRKRPSPWEQKAPLPMCHFTSKPIRIADRGFLGALTTPYRRHISYWLARGGKGRGGRGGRKEREGKGRGERGERERGGERASEAGPNGQPPPPTPPRTPRSSVLGKNSRFMCYVRAFTAFYCLLFLPDNRRFLWLFCVFFCVFLCFFVPST
jgi:hypothetical protein